MPDDEEEATVAVRVRPWLLWRRRGSKRFRVRDRRVEVDGPPPRQQLQQHHPERVHVALQRQLPRLPTDQSRTQHHWQSVASTLLQRQEPEMKLLHVQDHGYQRVFGVEVAERAQDPGGRVKVLVLLHQLGEPEVGDLTGFRSAMRFIVLGEQDVAGLSPGGRRGRRRRCWSAGMPAPSPRPARSAAAAASPSSPPQCLKEKGKNVRLPLLNIQDIFLIAALQLEGPRAIFFVSPLRMSWRLPLGKNS